MAFTQADRICSVETVLGDDAFLLKRFEGEEGISRLFTFRVELLALDESIDFDKLIGTNVTLSMRLHGEEKRYINGCVSRCYQAGADQRFVTYRLEIVPSLWLLTRRTDCRIFQDKTVPEILERVFATYGLEDFEIQATGAHDKRTYCVQYRESDFDFVSRLMESEGFHYHFRHEDGHHHLVIKDSSDNLGSCTLEAGAVYRATDEAPLTEDVIHALEIERVLQPGGYASTDYNFETPGTDLGVSIKSALESPWKDALEIYDFEPGQYGKVADGEERAKIRMGELEANALTLRGKGACRGFVPGFAFPLTGYYRADMDGKDYFLTRVMHVFSQPYEPQPGEQPFEYTNTFECIPAETVYRPRRLAPVPRIHGPQTAVVVGPEEERIYTDKYGRVKVMFHWDREGTYDEKSSCWIRVADFQAGAGWGFVSLPRVGQEVVVEFLEGNPDQPLVTGQVYNGMHMPPYKLPDERTKSTFKSKTYKEGPGFNEIRFEDKEDQEQIFIHAQKDYHQTVENDRKEEVRNNRDLTVKEKKREKVGYREETVENEHKETIGTTRSLTVKGEESKEIKKKLTLLVKGDVVEEFDKNHSEVTKKDYFLEADNVVIDAKTNITLSVGGTHIVLEKSGILIKTSGTLEVNGSQVDLKGTGKASLQGADVDIQGTAKVSVQGSALAELKGGIVKIN